MGKKRHWGVNEWPGSHGLSAWNCNGSGGGWLLAAGPGFSGKPWLISLLGREIRVLVSQLHLASI